MGRGNYLRSTNATELLANHPNLDIPEVPRLQADSWRMGAILDWTLDAAAEFISPLKEDGEDDEFNCGDVAQALRGPLREILWEKLLGLHPPPRISQKGQDEETER